MPSRLFKFFFAFVFILILCVWAAYGLVAYKGYQLAKSCDKGPSLVAEQKDGRTEYSVSCTEK